MTTTAWARLSALFLALIVLLVAGMVANTSFLGAAPGDNVGNPALLDRLEELAADLDDRLDALNA